MDVEGILASGIKEIGDFQKVCLLLQPLQESGIQSGSHPPHHQKVRIPKEDIPLLLPGRIAVDEEGSGIC